MEDLQRLGAWGGFLENVSLELRFEGEQGAGPWKPVSGDGRARARGPLSLGTASLSPPTTRASSPHCGYLTALTFLFVFLSSLRLKINNCLLALSTYFKIPIAISITRFAFPKTVYDVLEVLSRVSRTVRLAPPPAPPPRQDPAPSHLTLQPGCYFPLN